MTFRPPLVFAVAVAAIIILGIAGYRWYTAEEALQATNAALFAASSTIATLEETTEKAAAENRVLLDALAAEKARNDAFENQINEISGTVGRLDKLSKTDPELLQKYSKVYFLNENYIPSDLAQIDQQYISDTDDEFIHARVLPFLHNLMEAAEDDDIDLAITSAYRSFDTQKILKNGYAVRYGSGANAFSADQGYSEHQLGTTVDFVTNENGGALAISSETTEAFAWLEKNAHRHGFVLSYPKGNSYYQYEPWHWRFVGTDLAEDLHDDDQHFYDLDQRELDPYLVELFD